MYMYMYIGFRLFIVLRTKKRQNHRVPSLYEGPRPGLFCILGKFFKKKFFGNFWNPFFLKKNSENSNFFLETVSWKLEKSRSLKISKFKISKETLCGRERRKMKDFPRAKRAENVFFPYYPLFLHVRGGARRGDDRDVIMIIVLSILLFFCQFFTFWLTSQHLS